MSKRTKENVLKRSNSSETLTATFKRLDNQLDSPGKWTVKLNRISEDALLSSIENIQSTNSQETPKKKSDMVYTPRRSRILNKIDEEQNNNIDGNKDEVSPPKRSRRTSILVVENDVCTTPTSKSIPARRKSILKTPTVQKAATPRRSIQFRENIEEHESAKKKRTVLKDNIIADNDDSDDATDIALTRKRLHVSAVPNSLPCREKEYMEIYSFLEGNLIDKIGGCIYISGVPGTGKTATTSAVIRALKTESEKGKIPKFEYVEINGMRITEPRKAYVEINRQLTGKTVSAEQAYNLLDKRFSAQGAKKNAMTILLVDELDILCNKRQDVVYNLLNWPNTNSSKLIVITIANTFDLPERILMGKVTSRLGLTRLTFQPYSHKQLQEIVISRLSGLDCFNNDAVQLVARKVAALSGDARRALDICRRSSEIAETEARGENKKPLVSMVHVQKALNEMISCTKVKAVKACSKLEKYFLQAVCMEVERTGIEEVTFYGVYKQLKTVTALHGLPFPTTEKAFGISTRLGASRLIISEHARKDVYQKILLNISADDFYYATQLNTQDA